MTEKNGYSYAMMMFQAWKPHYVFKAKSEKPMAMAEQSIGILLIISVYINNIQQ